MRAGLLAFIFLPVLCFLGCNGKQQEKTDPMADFDTLYIRPGSNLEFRRFHTILVKEPDIYGHLPSTFLTTDTARYVYAIDSGRSIYNKKYFTATCFASQVKTDSSRVKVIGAKPVILEYHGNFYPGKRPAVTCYLTLDDTTVLLNNAENRIGDHENRIDYLETDAYVDGTKWKIFNDLLPGKNMKDSIRIDVRVEFQKPEKRTVTMH